ncbi:glycosyl hydrolase [Escherichia coli]|uniref:Glycosyl hydrolase n=1 Tax=Escherichia coli TaxID=562 RepID=A0A2X1IWR0_ECOLX|nr:glycosyl hydrolase [Escherichia coli]
MVRFSRYPHEAWQRELDFASGELRRNVVWRTSNGSGYTIASRRFVSADQLPLIALEITITPLDADASVLISTGIDATQTNHGRQHLDETPGAGVWSASDAGELHHPGWTQ